MYVYEHPHTSLGSLRNAQPHVDTFIKGNGHVLTVRAYIYIIVAIHPNPPNPPVHGPALYYGLLFALC